MQQQRERQALSTLQVASGLARWAVSRGLLERLPPEVDNQYLAAAPEVRMSAEAEQILRQKDIQSIAYNHLTRTIFIYTKRKVAQKDLQVLPVNLHSSGIAYPQGHVDQVGKEQITAQGACFTQHTAQTGNHAYTCGSSISPGNDASAGTLGALVRLQDGLLYGLTNNHVSALCSHVAPRTPILAPGVIDVGPTVLAPFTIGYHTASLEMLHGSVGNVNIGRNLDAAIFEIADAHLVSSMQGQAFDTPTTVSDPIEGMYVEKVGRTTHHTKGRIIGRLLRPIAVKYHAPRYGFSGDIWFANVFIVHGVDCQFSSSGDSGSLVVQTDEMGRPIGAVGIVFAGGPDALAPGGAMSLMLPIRPILEGLGAHLVGGHNV